MIWFVQNKKERTWLFWTGVMMWSSFHFFGTHMDTQYGTYAHSLSTKIYFYRGSSNRSTRRTVEIYPWYIICISNLATEKEVCLQAIKLPQCQNIGSCVGLYFKLKVIWKWKYLKHSSYFPILCLTYIIYMVFLICYALCIFVYWVLLRLEWWYRRRI